MTEDRSTAVSRGARVFHDDAHAAIAVVVDVSQNPDTGMRHLDDGRHTLAWRRATQQGQLPDWDGIAVERHDVERVSGQRETPNLGRARVENVQQNAVVGFDANRLAMTKASAVDRQVGVFHFESVRHSRANDARSPPRQSLLALVGLVRQQKTVPCRRRWRERRTEFFQHQEGFLVVRAGIILRLDVDGPTWPP